jgi:hypothetical protein
MVPSPTVLEYERRRRGVRRCFVLLVFFGFVAIGALLAPHAGRHLLLMYWQHQCTVYEPVVGQKLWRCLAANPQNSTSAAQDYIVDQEQSGLTAKLRPLCWQRLRPTVVYPAAWAAFDMRAVNVFCHERISHGGLRRLVVADFRGNVDHMQMCSLDFEVVTPAGFATPPAAKTSVEWTPGWWDNGVRRDRLCYATADPRDASHFTFS